MKQYLLVFACLLMVFTMQARTSPEQVLSSSVEDPITGTTSLPILEETNANVNFIIDRRELQEVSISVFPNPFSDQMTITAKDRIESYKIYNILGSLVAQDKSNTNVARIDTSKFNSGVYLLEVTSGNTKTTLKVIKR